MRKKHLIPIIGLLIVLVVLVIFPLLLELTEYEYKTSKEKENQISIKQIENPHHFKLDAHERGQYYWRKDTNITTVGIALSFFSAYRWMTESNDGVWIIVHHGSKIVLRVTYSSEPIKFENGDYVLSRTEVFPYALNTNKAQIQIDIINACESLIEGSMTLIQEI